MKMPTARLPGASKVCCLRCLSCGTLHWTRNPASVLMASVKCRVFVRVYGFLPWLYSESPSDRGLQEFSPADASLGKRQAAKSRALREEELVTWLPRNLNST
eukprot:s4397_g5.t1